MTKRQLKLGLVTTGVGGPGDSNRWLDPEIPVDASVNIDWYIDIVRQAEAAKFDLVFIVDSQFITADSPPHYLNRLEPLTLLSALAVATSHIGLVGTLTTSYNDPYNLARRLASLDLISKGRAGWNVVTTGEQAPRAIMVATSIMITRRATVVHSNISTWCAVCGDHTRTARWSAIARPVFSSTKRSCTRSTTRASISRSSARSTSSARRRANP